MGDRLAGDGWPAGGSDVPPEGALGGMGASFLEAAGETDKADRQTGRRTDGGQRGEGRGEAGAPPGTHLCAGCGGSARRGTVARPLPAAHCPSAAQRRGRAPWVLKCWGGRGKKKKQQ